MGQKQSCNSYMAHKYCLQNIASNFWLSKYAFARPTDMRVWPDEIMREGTT